MIELMFLMILMFYKASENCIPKPVLFFYYQRFSDKVFKFQPNACTGCHGKNMDDLAVTT